MSDAPFDTRLIEYANTPVQRERLEAWAKHGSQAAAAAALGCDPRAIRKARSMAEKNAARQGYAPGHFEGGVAPGYLMGKVTVQRGPDGKVERAWERQHPDDLERERALRNAYEAMASDLPRLAPVSAPKHVLTDLCNLYTLTDTHIGMMAWRKEGGSDWDLKIAEKTIIGCFAAMIDAAPASETCIVASLGDLLHWDGLVPVTPTSGHILDADGRFSKVVQVAIRVLRTVIDMALAKHEKVVFLPAEGNHDIASTVWLRCMFAALYENEDRVDVINSELPYYAVEHGETALFWHHSHLKRLHQLPLLMAAQFPEIWGRTKRRFCHTGDKHHTEEKEHSGIIVVQHPTLAARDAYASRHGWHALRRATGITYHKKYGEVARTTVCPEMLES